MREHATPAEPLFPDRKGDRNARTQDLVRSNHGCRSGKHIIRDRGDYQERPPRKIAVLPFVDEGKGTYLIDKISVKTRDKEELNQVVMDPYQPGAPCFAGDLATREFSRPFIKR